MRYVYGCDCGNREDVVHPMVAPHTVVACSQCGSWMHRVPQAFTWYHNPVDTLLDKLDEGYRNYRTKKAKGAKHGSAN